MQSGSKSIPTTPKIPVNGDATPTADVRERLAAAVVAWWQRGALPSDALLQQGLLALEAGTPLEPSQRTLLARTALTRGLGVVTSLRHVNDAERVASLVHEAWSNGVLESRTLSTILAETRAS